MRCLIYLLIYQPDVLKYLRYFTFSVPGIAERIAFKSLHADTTFFLFNKTNRDLVHLFLSNNLGGPALIFTRFAEKGDIFSGILIGGHVLLDMIIGFAIII